MTDQVKNLMNILSITEEEALQIIADDEKIDKGEKLFEQTAEQKANSKKASAVGSRKATPAKREKKENADRKYLISCLSSAVAPFSPTVTNDECQIDLTYNGTDYSVKLIAHRPKK